MVMTVGKSLVPVCCLLLLVSSAAIAAGPLRVHPKNPRYFTDESGQAILLVGSHTWNNLVDMGPSDPPEAFDYEAYLDWLVDHHHNFFRLWAWELLAWDTTNNRERHAQQHHVAPHPWKRTGPKMALDGKPRFDLTKFNEIYFDRLRDRVAAAQARGLYPAVMLFEGWGLQFAPEAWKNHPFNPLNNLNDVNGDLDGDGKGVEIHTNRDPAVTKIQKRYVRKIIDTVNSFDNVLYEISNENHPASTRWQYDMIQFIRDYEKDQPKQHPVGMTFQYKGGSNETLFASPADWISPNNQGGYRDNPPAADGRKVVISDTDHLWGIGGNADWVWKSFLRGLNPIFMDPYKGNVLSRGYGEQECEPIRHAMGLALEWSQRIDLVAATPHGELASTGYCLANPGKEYLVYCPGKSPEVTVALPNGDYRVLWFNTRTGQDVESTMLEHRAGEQTLAIPFDGNALLHLVRDSQ
jgi:hypothetical protein